MGLNSVLLQGFQAASAPILLVLLGVDCRLLSSLYWAGVGGGKMPGPTFSSW